MGSGQSKQKLSDALALSEEEFRRKHGHYPSRQLVEAALCDPMNAGEAWFYTLEGGRYSGPSFRGDGRSHGGGNEYYTLGGGYNPRWFDRDAQIRRLHGGNPNSSGARRYGGGGQRGSRTTGRGGLPSGWSGRPDGRPDRRLSDSRGDYGPPDRDDRGADSYGSGTTRRGGLASGRQGRPDLGLSGSQRVYARPSHNNRGAAQRGERATGRRGRGPSVGGHVRPPSRASSAEHPKGRDPSRRGRPPPALPHFRGSHGIEEEEN